MTVADEFSQFADELRLGPEPLRTELRTFPAGGTVLDVFFADRLFVLAYFPRHRLYCVDEARPEDGIGSDYRFGFPDFDSAKQQLEKLLREARATVSAD